MTSRGCKDLHDWLFLEIVYAAGFKGMTEQKPSSKHEVSMYPSRGKRSMAEHTVWDLVQHRQHCPTTGSYHLTAFPTGSTGMHVFLVFFFFKLCPDIRLSTLLEVQCFCVGHLLSISINTHTHARTHSHALALFSHAYLLLL